THEALLNSNRHLLELSSVENAVSDDMRRKNVIIPPVYIAADACIEDSIVGPFTTIGEKVQMKASIVQDSIIGDRAFVKNVLLNRSVVGRETLLTGTFNQLSISDNSEITF
ncbi:MAG: nucleotidyl transferase, partial [bacterium]